ncbi:MAG: primosomal protein N', partial [Actinobacteria bacterium]|nr:primosomal protein N' [Actinomycetota bacterium]
MRLAHVIIDIPTRALDSAFDYLVPASMKTCEVGCCVLVDFGNRPVVAYVIGLEDVDPDLDLGKYKFIREVLSAPYFDAVSATCAEWIAQEYAAVLSETIHLFAPPGGAPKVKQVADEHGTTTWELVPPGAGPVDDRWARITET